MFVSTFLRHWSGRDPLIGSHVGGYKLFGLTRSRFNLLVQHPRGLGSPMARAKLIEQGPVKSRATGCALLGSHGPELFADGCHANVRGVSSHFEVVPPEVILLALVELRCQPVRLPFVVEGTVGVTRVVVVKLSCTPRPTIACVKVVRFNVVNVILVLGGHAIWRFFKL